MRAKLRLCSKSCNTAQIGLSLSHLLGLGKRSTKAKRVFKSGAAPFHESRPPGAFSLLPRYLTSQPTAKKAGLCSPRMFRPPNRSSVMPIYTLPSASGATALKWFSQWVRFVLEGNSEAASKLFKGASEFPVALTRDLNVAREWLHARDRGDAPLGLLWSFGKFWSASS